jgi:hypothetical protein
LACSRISDGHRVIADSPEEQFLGRYGKIGKGTAMPPANPLLSRTIAVAATIAAFVVFSLAMIVVRARNASRQATTQMRTTFSTEEPIVAQAEKHEQSRHAILVQELRTTAKAKRAVKTPAEAAARLPEALAPLPRSFSVNLPPNTQDEPAAPAVITVPQADLKPLFDHLQDCRACQEQLSTAQQDLKDEQVKVSALTIERDTAVKASRGGGFWSRLRTGAKWFAIGGVMGALAASAAHR